jgi:homoserine kinase
MDDAVVEIARKKMVPGYDRVKASAKKAGASGVCISGAGPSVLAVVDGEKADPKAVLMAIVRRFRAEGVTATGFETRSGQGALVIESS